MPPAVERRSDDGIGVVIDAGTNGGRGIRVGSTLARVVVLKIDELGESDFELVRIGLIPILVLLTFSAIVIGEIGVWDTQCSTKLEDPAECRISDSGNV